MSRTRFVFAWIADMAIRIGTFVFVGDYAHDIATTEDLSIYGILLGTFLFVIYAAYLWRAMDAEHALTLLEHVNGMRVRVVGFGGLNIGIDPNRFGLWLNGITKQIEQRADEEMREAA